MEFDGVLQGLELEGTIEDLKLIYRVLHQHLNDHLELLDSPLFSSLQETLQQAAFAEGVDVTDHGQWQSWLAQGAPAEPKAQQGMLN